LLRKIFACEVKAAKDGSNATTFSALVSTPSVDSDGETLDPLGCELDPGSPVLYGHDYWSLRANIGVLDRAETSAERVINYGTFDDDIPEHTDAIIAASKARKKRLQKQSVGFIPKVVQRPTGEVITLAAGQWIYSEPGTRYLKWLQCELSFVPVGSNPDTDLLSARGHGGPESRGLRDLMRKVLEELAVDDEFLDRLKAARERTKSAASSPATPALPTPEAAPAAAGGGSGAAGTIVDEIDALLAGEEPARVAGETDDPERLAAAVAAAARATTDIDELFDTEPAPETAGTGAEG
jgi:hypothetical protein